MTITFKLIIETMIIYPPRLFLALMLILVHSIQMIGQMHPILFEMIIHTMDSHHPVVITICTNHFGMINQ